MVCVIFIRYLYVIIISKFPLFRKSFIEQRLYRRLNYTYSYSLDFRDIVYYFWLTSPLPCRYVEGTQTRVTTYDV